MRVREECIGRRGGAGKGSEAERDRVLYVVYTI